MTDRDLGRWRKSSHSGSEGGACVEVAPLAGGRVGVRHSQDPDGPVIVCTATEWAALTAGVRAGDFDLD